jgi:hypothetical protein
MAESLCPLSFAQRNLVWYLLSVVISIVLFLKRGIIFYEHCKEIHPVQVLLISRGGVHGGQQGNTFRQSGQRS